jgi:hypothetical protein
MQLLSTWKAGSRILHVSDSWDIGNWVAFDRDTLLNSYFSVKYNRVSDELIRRCKDKDNKLVELTQTEYVRICWTSNMLWSVMSSSKIRRQLSKESTIRNHCTTTGTQCPGILLTMRNGTRHIEANTMVLSTWMSWSRNSSSWKQGPSTNCELLCTIVKFTVGYSRTYLFFRHQF